MRKPIEYVLWALTALVLLAAGEATVVETFDGGALPANFEQNDAVAVVQDGVLEVQFAYARWPSVRFSAPKAAWDWSGYTSLAVDVYNPGLEPVAVSMRVDSAGADGVNACNEGNATAGPGEMVTLAAELRRDPHEIFWGMRGLPLVGPVPKGSGLDPARVTAYQFYLPRPAEPHALQFDNVRLVRGEAPLEDRVPLPFIDRFGQFAQGTWPGKLADESELAARKEAEREALERSPAPAGRDRFGGWADGPQLEATGWFRTERIDGKWWLITPEGRLFFSSGMNCVGVREQTFVDGRAGWFAWLPERDDPLYGDLFRPVRGSHSMSERIGGAGTTFCFYGANLVRKYGADWQSAWRDTTYARLRAWGFNTIANWSDEEVLAHSPIPFTATASIRGEVRHVEGASGYWGKLMDVYDPAWAAAAEASIVPVARRFADNPLCIGYFVDNERPWESLRKGVLASPVDQPCRIVFIEQLKAKYGALDALNMAWGTEAASWDALQLPPQTNAAYNADLDALETAFAGRCFETIKGILRKHAPHQLYLGCRFSSVPPAVLRACAQAADVVSVNVYAPFIESGQWTGDRDLGKPVLIGEFHFGALDRGMFHTGLVATPTQAERARSYARYVRSVANCPALVGCHWFQYVDQPVTGRWYDGENFNIGFVDVTDTPYPELVDAAKGVHAEVYARRYGGAR